MPLLGLDDATVRFLETHRLRSLVLPGRGWTDLGDAVMLFSASEVDPFFNRLSAVRWPANAAMFEKRLAQARELFTALDRQPYIWVTPGATTPPDIVARLKAHGFVDQGGGMDMVLVREPGSADAVAAGDTEDRPLPPGATISHWFGTPPDQLEARARALALVVGDAFAIPADRRPNLIPEIDLTLRQPAFHAYVVEVDGEPVATGQRYTFDGASYLSSIGTRPEWRGRGFGTAITLALARDSIAENARLVYLGVHAGNDQATSVYARLGFAALGSRSSDMLLVGKVASETAGQARHEDKRSG